MNMDELSAEDLAMLEWLKSASNDEIIREMRKTEQEIFRNDDMEY